MYSGITRLVLENFGKGQNASISLEDTVLTVRLHIAEPEDQHEVSTGKLTGQQIKTIHALEQLLATITGFLPVIQMIAETTDEQQLRDRLIRMLTPEMQHEDDPETEAVAYAIRGMALFCYAEIQERGLDNG